MMCISAKVICYSNISVYKSYTEFSNRFCGNIIIVTVFSTFSRISSFKVAHNNKYFNFTQYGRAVRG